MNELALFFTWGGLLSLLKTSLIVLLATGLAVLVALASLVVLAVVCVCIFLISTMIYYTFKELYKLITGRD